jgi:hypothetical protein
MGKMRAVAPYYIVSFLMFLWLRAIPVSLTEAFLVPPLDIQRVQSIQRYDVSHRRPTNGRSTVSSPPPYQLQEQSHTYSEARSYSDYSPNRKRKRKSQNYQKKLQILTELNDQLFRSFDSLWRRYQDVVVVIRAESINETAVSEDDTAFSALESMMRHYKAVLRQTLAVTTTSRPRTSLSEGGGTRMHRLESGIRQQQRQGSLTEPEIEIVDMHQLLFMVRIHCCESKDSRLVKDKVLQTRVVFVLTAFLRIEVALQAIGRSAITQYDNSRIVEELWETCQTLIKDIAQNGSVPCKVLMSSLAVSLREDYQQRGDCRDGATQLLVLMELFHMSTSQNTDSEIEPHKSDRKRVLSFVWNMYLSSLCDQALETRNPADENLGKAVSMIRNPKTMQRFSKILPNFHPDIVSFNTVMDAAAKVGNHTIAEDLWNLLQTFKDALRPTSRTFNARLSALRDPTKKLELFDKEILPSIHRSCAEVLDGFTIDLLVKPLLQAGRKDDLYRIIEVWISSTAHLGLYQQRKLLQDHFCAFLSTVSAQNDHKNVAMELFDRYMMINVTEVTESPYALNLVLPQRRHFNVMIDIYAKIAYRALEQIQKHFELVNESTFNHGTEAVRNSEYLASLEASREKAIQCAQSLYATMKTLHEKEPMRQIFPDDYTRAIMVRCCRSSNEIAELIHQTSAVGDSGRPAPAVLRSAIGMCGLLRDPSMSCVFFEKFLGHTSDVFADTRLCNVLLSALADGARLGNAIMDFSGASNTTSRVILTSLQGLTCSDAVLYIFDQMNLKDSQSYCNSLAALQYADIEPKKKSEIGLELFRNATKEGIAPDGRILNAMLRCFGDDIDGALDRWKNEIRPAYLSHENGDRGGSGAVTIKNLLAAYDGLVYVCGRAERPDIAVRIVYAMQREGIELSERTFNSYNGGKRTRQKLVEEGKLSSAPRLGLPSILPKISLVKQYEDVLYVECKKYNTRDRRMEKDMRVRIIV